MEKIRRILYRIDEAGTIGELNVVGRGLQQLKGSLSDYWSVKVNGNYRLIFRFEDGNAFDLDYIDYH